MSTWVHLLLLVGSVLLICLVFGIANLFSLFSLCVLCAQRCLFSWIVFFHGPFDFLSTLSAYRYLPFYYVDLWFSLRFINIQLFTILLRGPLVFSKVLTYSYLQFYYVDIWFSLRFIDIQLFTILLRGPLVFSKVY